MGRNFHFYNEHKEEIVDLIKISKKTNFICLQRGLFSSIPHTTQTEKGAKLDKGRSVDER